MKKNTTGGGGEEVSSTPVIPKELSALHIRSRRSSIIYVHN